MRARQREQERQEKEAFKQNSEPHGWQQTGRCNTCGTAASYTKPVKQPICFEYDANFYCSDCLLDAEAKRLTALAFLPDHNHFELKPVELGADGFWSNVYQNNGYFGNIKAKP